MWDTFRSDLEQIFLRKTRFLTPFWAILGPFGPKMASFGDLEGPKWVCEAQKPFGTPLEVFWSNFFF